MASRPEIGGGRLFLAAAVAGLALLALAGWLTYRSLDSLVEAQRSFARSSGVIAHSYLVSAQFQELVLAHRGFLMTKEQQFQVAYRGQLPQVLTRLRELQELTAEDALHQLRVRELRSIIDSYDEFARRTFRPKQDDLERQGEQEYAAFSGMVAAMVARERTRLREHAGLVESRLQASFGLMVGANLLAFLLVGLTGFSLRLELRRRGELQVALREANEELTRRVEERTADLTQSNHQLIQEVQKQVLTEALLRGSEERYRQLVELFPDAIFIHQEFHIQFSNTAAQTLFGLPADRLIGRNLLDFIRPEFIAQARERYRRMAETGERAPFIEIQVVTAAGRTVDVETAAVPLRNRQGLSVQVVMRDVTERKKSMARIHDQASLLEMVQDAVLVTDMADALQFWNLGAQRLYGWRPVEVIGKPSFELMHAGPDAVRDEAVSEVRRCGAWSGELNQVTRGGQRITVDSRWSLVRDNAGQPRGIVMVNTDVTDKKAMEGRFLRAQRLESIGTLAGGIAHDLNNVLTPILMSVRLLKKDRAEHERKNLLLTAEASVERGADMVRQLLTFAGGGESRRIPVQLSKVLHEVVSLLRHTLPKSTIIHMDAPEDLWPILGDPTQVAQVLMNLCVNARDAMPDGGTLTIAAANHGPAVVPLADMEVRHRRHVAVTVSDTGTGIAAHLLDKIFDPFFTTKEQGKGTGLGLFTTLGIVRAHGGAITVYSEAGAGACFSLFFPANISEAVPPVADTPRDGPAGAGQTVLIVDDEQLVLDATRAVLQSGGYRALTAMNGADALETLRHDGQDVKAVILDMMMPGMDGAEVLRELVKLRPDLPVIAASGLRGHSRMQEIMALGARGFLHKPYTDEQLFQALGTVLQPAAAQT